MNFSDFLDLVHSICNAKKIKSEQKQLHLPTQDLTHMAETSIPFKLRYFALKQEQKFKTKLRNSFTSK